MHVPPGFIHALSPPFLFLVMLAASNTEDNARNAVKAEWDSMGADAGPDPQGHRGHALT